MSIKTKKDEPGRNSESEMQLTLSDFSKFYILLLLSESVSHGYELIKKYKRRTGRELSAVNLYPFLQSLELNGFVWHRDEPV